MAEPIELRPRGRCAVCGKAQAARWRPFCSKRCADIDLGRWLTEHYRIPTLDDPTGENDEER